MAEPDFWTHKERAQLQVEEVSTIRGKVTPVAQLQGKLDDLEALIELAREEADPTEIAADVEKEHIAVIAELAMVELKMLLSGPNDRNDAFLSVQSGAGGTEACDWADMLLRM